MKKYILLQLSIILILTGCSIDNYGSSAKAVIEETKLTDISKEVTCETTMNTTVDEIYLQDFIEPELEEDDWHYIDGLSTTQLLLFNKACVAENKLFRGSYSWYFNAVYENFITGNTGIKYSSFREYLLSIFTEEYVEYLLNDKYLDRFKNVNDELIMNATGYSSDPYFRGITFEVKEKNDYTINIQGTAVYYSNDYTNEDVLKENKIYEYYQFVMKRTSDGWRIAYFESWY